MTDRNCGDDRLDLHADTAVIRDEQVRRALRRLDDCGGLTPYQRATVERMADRLTVELLDMFDTDQQTIKKGKLAEGNTGYRYIRTSFS